jgi:DNA-binding CsgD family transcriptional regulator
MDTIRTHLRTARAKLGATNTTHAVALAKRLDLIT